VWVRCILYCITAVMSAQTDFALSLQSQQKSVNQIWLRFDSQTILERKKDSVPACASDSMDLSTAV
jgi:hypothetical protein